MGKKFVAAFTSTLLSMVLSSAWADFDAGLAEYEKGNFSAASTLFRACLPQPNCQTHLGLMYAHGNGVAQDDGEALKLFRLAAAQDFALAQSSLGFMFLSGQGVPQDKGAAAEWFRLAADKGVANAQFMLGLLYELGQGVPQGQKESARWYRLAAVQGHGMAQNNLGLRYENGQGVPQNYKEAIEWFRLAADQGIAYAQANLGSMYAKGTGVKKNLVLAYSLSNLSVTNGAPDGARENRESILKSLSGVEAATAQRLTNEMYKTGKVSTIIDRYSRTGK